MGFGTGSHMIAQTGLELIILLLLASEQNYRCVRLHLAGGIFFFSWSSLSLTPSTEASSHYAVVRFCAL